jgi:dTDP-4-dehydrorhamnose reductase
MKVLVTGSSGMLGKALVPCLEARGHTVRGLPREELDVTNYDQVFETLSRARPDIVIHSAAYTNVDQAESEPELAYLINGYGSENLAVACARFDTAMVYVSTDYVFDGQQNRPYQPWDQTNPLSVYGKSKLAGEKAVTNHLSRFQIVRTSWLYGPYGKNFVETILKLAAEKDVLRVVADQFGSPTSTLSLSEIIADLIVTERWGIYHATDGGTTTWHEFAQAILHDRKQVRVEAIETKDFPRPATRPKYSVLDKTSLINTIGREMVPWQDALNNYLNLRLQMQPA